jgi:transcriptional regulator with XRE-family HTH domain
VDETDGSDQHMRQLGEYIRMQRQMADLSLRRMAEMTRVSNAYLSQVERGLHQPSIRVLRSIAGALNVSADTLLIQAGLMDAAPTPEAEDDVAAPGPVIDTEAAIRNDPDLSPADQDALIRIYRTFKRHADDA